MLSASVFARSLSCVRLFCGPVVCSLPGCSVRRLFQARILECVAISFSRRSSPPRDQTCVSVSPALEGGFFTMMPSEKPYLHLLVTNDAMNLLKNLRPFELIHIFKNIG